MPSVFQDRTKEDAMAKKTIDLHRIAAEIRSVQERLRAARVVASPAEAAQLDLRIEGLESLHEQARGLCGRVYGVWGPPDVVLDPPPAAAPAGRRPRAD
jgi:hypothetical protein